MRDVHGQGGWQVRFDWGTAGADAIVAELAVVVDVLSFSTAVSVAAERGIEVFPFAWRDDRAAVRAAELGATLARGRREGNPSLSPASLRAWGAPAGTRLLLPSPNGSSISFGLADRGCRVVAGCLRTAAATADWLAGESGRAATIAVIAAGERWPDGSLRPAVEDLWGAGAIIARLAHRGWRCSPEALAAAAGYAAAEPDLAGQLAACASGQELVTAGFEADVALAAELDASRAVPVLVDGAFRATEH